MAFNASDKSSPGAYTASQTALLLLDFHEQFVNVAAGDLGKRAASIAVNMRHWAHTQGIQVIHAPLDLESTPVETYKDRDRLIGLLETLRQEGGSEPAALLDGDEGDVTLTRRLGQVSAMGSPGLQEYPMEKGIKSLIMTGLSTSGCVLWTALSASDLGFIVTTISDACADPKSGAHDLLISQVLNNRGWVMTAAEFQEGFGRAK
ncbi:unnamed protein product [Zymoseptoria tritici ST99CH_1A5]|uniref:Isochorismatase-like domain-containing protein n=1 Tax=Zymoseptoria tritici ST99CH_1A5 TaxID=1276529 RepID=A0A1Y6LTD8_ZYMTR|nr:unnamed protein product [Zymoseptoria tritici ST99CH_1A5]